MPSKPGERKRRPLEWNEAQKKALAAVFEGRKSRAKIAEDCAIPSRTLDDWIAHPEFQDKLKSMREQMLDAFDALGVAYVRKEQRIMALSQMAEEARQEWEECHVLREYRPVLVKRPADTTSQHADGEQEAREPRMLMVEDYIITERLNEAALTQSRQMLADIAAELGARKNVTELTGKDGEALPGLVINLVPATAESKAKYRRQGLSVEAEETLAEDDADGRGSDSSQP